MVFFNFGKKNESSCSIGKSSGQPDRDQVAVSGSDAAKAARGRVKVLGSGCTKCRQLETAAQIALKQLGSEAEIDHVTDLRAIAAYGVMTTPALVVDGKVVSCGRVLAADEIAMLLRKAGW